MKCAVIKIVISLVISGICLAAGDMGDQLAIMDEPSTKIQSCIGKIIEHILSPSESLAFVITSHPDYIPSWLPNPVTIVDIRAPLPTHYKRYEVNYVIEAEDWTLFERTFNTILRSPLWRRKESAKGKFVILVKDEQIMQWIFISMWQQIQSLHIIVVIYDDTSKNCPMKVIMSNPHAVGNNCGRKLPTVFSNCSCSSISIEFLKPIRNYNRCPVYILPYSQYFIFDFNMKAHRVMYNLLAGLKHVLNVTPIALLGGSVGGILEKSLIYRNEIMMLVNHFGRQLRQFFTWEDSIIFLRQQFIWFGPLRKPIFPLNTVLLPFKYDLWIAVLLITILMVLVKWIIMKVNGYYNNNYVALACAFTDIIALTFNVSIYRIPNIFSLKLLLGFFFVYIIHIHTAYTSDLINILTEQRYDTRISNLEELVVSNLPIYMPYVLAKNYFNHVNDSNTLFGKISKSIIPFRIHDSPSEDSVSKCFIARDEDSATVLNSHSTFNIWYIRKMKVNAFLTSDLTGEIKSTLQLKPGSYFIESLNAVITHLLESGTFEANAWLNPSPYFVQLKESESVLGILLSDNQDPQPLCLKHLLPIFVILLICYSFSIMIFLAEIFLHKIVTLLHSTRNQVVPLNV